MSASPREFDAGPDPFGKTWNVQFLWLQTAVSIRHADTVDVKFLLTHDDRAMEKVVALPLPDLIALSEREGRPITDPWCMRLAALHVRHMVETGEDFEKQLVTVPLDKLIRYAAMLAELVV